MREINSSSLLLLLLMINIGCAQYPECYGLIQGWGETMDTQFGGSKFDKIEAGTVLQLSCAYPEAEFRGSREVTCITGNGYEYSYSEEPSCVIPGWETIWRGYNGFKKEHDMETTPVEIMTNTVIGTHERMYMYFAPLHWVPTWEYAGGFFISFRSPTVPQYSIWHCFSNGGYRDFPVEVPSEIVKVWRITFGRTSNGGRQIIVHCNNKEVLNIELTESLCDDRDYKLHWTRDPKWVIFSGGDQIADYYRPAPAPCSAGDYMTESGCQQCGENTYSGDAAESCTSCPEGTISAAGSTSEEACEAAVKISVIPVKSSISCKSGKKKCSVMCKVITDGTLDKTGMKICKLENGEEVGCKAAQYKKKKFRWSLGKVTAETAGQYVCHYTENGVEKTSSPITLSVKGGKNKKKKGRI